MSTRGLRLVQRVLSIQCDFATRHADRQECLSYSDPGSKHSDPLPDFGCGLHFYAERFTGAGFT